MIVPTTEVARLACCLYKISDGVVKVMESLTGEGVHICGPMGFDEILSAVDEAKAVLDAVVAENPGGEHDSVC